MFDARSRYRAMPTYETTDEHGRAVRAVRLPLPPQPPDGEALDRVEHLLRQGERLDLLAARFLGEPAGFWRLCDANNTMLPDDLRVPGRRIVITV